MREMLKSVKSVRGSGLAITQFLTFFLLSAFFDQISKFWVTQILSPGNSIPLIKNILYLSYFKNKGLIFGYLALPFSLIVILNILVLFLIVVWGISPVRCLLSNRVKLEKTKMVRITLGIIGGGVGGNSCDRIFRKGVIDFLDFKIWPVFNLADVFIVIGVVLLAREILTQTQ